MLSNIILSIETSTESCSVALSSNGDLIAEKYINSPKVHASVIAPFINDILLENGLTLNDCSAVAVSEGPGSYTGLRVGVSTAKGLCYGSKKPLIAVDTLAIIAQCALDTINKEQKIIEPFYIVPMIDARRMEVYTATFDNNIEKITKTEAKILNSNSFSELLKKRKVIFTGDGMEKFKTFFAADDNIFKNSIFIEQMPHASGLRIIADKMLKNKDFKDCAYFEPFYLKEFIAGKPKKLL